MVFDHLRKIILNQEEDYPSKADPWVPWYRWHAEIVTPWTKKSSWRRHWSRIYSSHQPPIQWQTSDQANQSKMTSRGENTLCILQGELGRVVVKAGFCVRLATPQSIWLNKHYYNKYYWEKKEKRGVKKLSKKSYIGEIPPFFFIFIYGERLTNLFIYTPCWWLVWSTIQLSSTLVWWGE